MEFSQIAILLFAAASFAIIARMFRQPVIVGYIFAGFLVATLGLASDISVFSGLSEIGVALLLFLVGVEMNLSEIPTIGKVALMAGVGQIAVTSTVGFLIARLLGLATVPAIYIGIALTFSSTIVIVKLLSEKKDLGSLYGKISLGILLVQDIVAVLIIMFLAGLKNNTLAPADFLLVGVKGVILIAASIALSKKVLPYIFDRFLAKNSELLFITSIAWALGVAALVGGPIGFTLEIGGFLAGLSLSNLPEHLQIASRTKPLRDFFLTIFFMILGTHIVLSQIAGVLLPAIIFSIFVVLGNTVIMMFILGRMGHTKRTSFLAALTVAQISEFSLILVTMGQSLGHVTGENVSMIILVGIITMTVSTYLIMGSDKIYVKIKRYLSIFERKRPKETALNVAREMKDHIVVVGAGRTGKTVIAYLTRNKIPFIVVDFNPKVFNHLTAERVPVLFGDIGDPDIFDLAYVKDARMVISTTSDLLDNLTLMENVRRLKDGPLTLFTTNLREDGLVLYEKGADYVLVPQRIAGEHIRHVLRTYGANSDKIKKLGKSNFNRLLTK